jgi:heme a synthase
MATMAETWLRRGLVLAVITCLILTTFGAFVRLSDAGLGCPDWPTCYGKLSWPKADDVASANAAFPERPVEHHKTWPEQVHRHIAAGLGVLVLALCLLANHIQRRSLWPIIAGTALIGSAVALYIVKQSMLSGVAMVLGELILIGSAIGTYGVARWMIVTLALISFQALLGMWTVTLLVKPAVVTAHLLGGFSTLGLLLWNLLMQRGGKSGYQRQPAIARKFLMLSAGVLLLQITLGGWVSTNYAALACPDFPTCKGQWWPESNFKEGFVLWREVGVNYEGGVLDAPARTAVHLTHRFFAIIAALVLGLLGASALLKRPLAGPAGALLVTLCAQIALGISNVVFALPLWMAVAHNGVAACLMCALIWLAWRNENPNSHRSGSIYA